MADFDSSLPVRTQTPGDVAAKIVDATTPSQGLAVDASGRIIAKIEDSAGNNLNSHSNALDVYVTNPISVTTGVADESAFTYGTSLQLPIGGVYNSSITPLTSGQSGVMSLTPNRDLRVNLRTAAGAELGNSAADKLFVQSTDGTNSQVFTAAGEAKVDMTASAAFGSVSGGTAGSLSDLVGGIYNTALPTLTNGQQAAFQLDSSGRLIIAPLSSASVVTVSNLPATVDVNYGTVGASTLRSAAQIGNATGAADFNAGATGAQTLRVVANQGAANATPWNENIAQIAGAVPSATNALPAQIATAGAFVSPSNPLPVIIDPAGAGTPVMDYKNAAAIGTGASDNHDYTVTAGKTLYLQSIESSAPGKAKMTLSIETGVASGVFTVKAAQFNSTATPNMSLSIAAPILVAAGVRVRVNMSNNDLGADNLYSTILGFEV